MSFSNVFDIAGSAMNAQTVRLNTTASNMANAGSVSGNPDNVYRPLMPVFATESNSFNNKSGVAEVRLKAVIESMAEPQKIHQPDHPEADADGYVYASNVNVVEELTNMISASRSYQNGVEMISTAKDLLLQTLSLGR